ncbi:radical SAM protein [Actinophytocola sp. KF-1]
MDRQLTLVVKSSKFCNLRCRYCYEFAELGSRDRMGRANLRRLYRTVRDHVVAADARDGARTTVNLIWHGGEPLLLPPEYYWETFADLRAELAGVPHRNVVQTNLTVLDDARLDLLRTGFDSVGVSVDLFGGLRVNQAGRDSQDRVLANLERLRAEGVPHGCITVLTAANIRRVEEIFEHYVRTRTSFRVLPLFDGAFTGQHTGYDVSSAEIVTALTTLFDLWLASPAPITIDPVTEYVERALRYLGGAPPRYYDRRAWLDTLLVDTNGDAYAYGDPYGEPGAALGNVFTTPLTDVLSGPAFDRSARTAETRIAANCVGCALFGACDGSYVAEAEPAARTVDPATGVRACVVERAVLTHITNRLRTVPDLVA